MNAQAKGRSYVAEGRLLVLVADEIVVEATCRGDGAVYDVGHDEHGWFCSCPARGRCAHLVALGLVVAPARSLEP